ncbi:hypothetical protein ACP4OV_021236 [Aristida adscensionis]
METPKDQRNRRNGVQCTIPLLIMSHDPLPLPPLPSSLPWSAGDRRRRRWPARSFVPVRQAMAQHLDLLLVALLYGGLFSGALLVATALALLGFLAGAVLATLALAASDARRLAAPAARAAGAAAAHLRLARALAVYYVLRAVVRVVVAVRPKVGALVPRVRGCVTDYTENHRIQGDV